MKLLQEGEDRVGLYIRMILWCTHNSDCGSQKHQRRAIAIILRINNRALREGWHRRLTDAFRLTHWAGGAGTSRVNV